jgi:hypothetical protein
MGSNDGSSRAGDDADAGLRQSILLFLVGSLLIHRCITGRTRPHGRTQLQRQAKCPAVATTRTLLAGSCTSRVLRRDENGFGIFRNSGNRFRNFSIGFIGNGIFRKRNRFSEFSIGIGIGIGVVFYRPFPSVTGFCRKLPDLCLGNFRNCVSEFFRNFFRNFPACDFFASPVHLWIRITYFVFFGRFKIFLG